MTSNLRKNIPTVLFAVKVYSPKSLLRTLSINMVDEVRNPLVVVFETSELKLQPVSAVKVHCIVGFGLAFIASVI